MRKIEIRKCELCSNDFEVNINNKRSNKKRFCSSICAIKYNGLNNKGKKRTDEYKKEMSIKNSGKNNPFYGKKHTIDSISKMSKSSQWNENKYKYCNMTENEKEIFDGIMISDGSLNNSRISARLTLGFKYLETVNRIINDLPSINFSTPWKYNTYNNIHKKNYIHFFTKSNSYRDLLFEYNRWYNNNIKIIPSDIEITPLMCYWWYVCDGYLTDNNVYLCTDNFQKKYLKLISNKMKKNGFNNSITTRNRIRLPKKDTINFLNYISNINIQKEYLYKWNDENNKII